MDNYASCRLYERFDDEGGDAVGVFGERPFEFGEAMGLPRTRIKAERDSKSGRAGDSQRRAQKSFVTAMKGVDVANTRGSDCVTVIGTRQADE